MASLAPWRTSRLATLHTSPLVREAGHNISPGLRKQLVLELELWISGGEVLATFPRRLFFWQAAPLDQEAPCTSPLLGLQNALRDRHNAAILCRRKGTRRPWRVAAMLLEEADVEDIMQAGAFRKL